MPRLSTPVFFRMSYYNQIKFNQNTFFDYHYDYGTTYKFDILIDWPSKTAALYINSEFKVKSTFYSNGRDELLSDAC